MEGGNGRAGVILRTLRHFFASSTASSSSLSQFASPTPSPSSTTTNPASGSVSTVSISMLEIYNEGVFDLLSGVTLDESSAHTPGDSSGGGGGGKSVGGKAATTPGASRVANGLSSTSSSSLSSWGRRNSSGRGTPTNTPTDPSSYSSSYSSGLPVRDTAAGVVEVVGLTRVSVPTLAAALKVVQAGSAARSVGAHSLNERSSRSHMLVRLWVTGTTPYAMGSGGASTSVVRGVSTTGGPAFPFTSVVNLVDLAGSERVSRSGAEGTRLREAASINSSLSTLGSVIAALKRRAAHVPFRDSKLTFILRESLAVGGGARVLLLACVGPDGVDAGESSCTLQFAARCRDTALGVVSGGQ